VPATTRASFALYNTTEEIDVLAKAIHRALKVFD
jgi:cysteine desulfurase / selenocysteine lyase